MEEISREEIRDHLGDPSVVLVDARPAEAFAQSRIPGSLSLPVADVERRARALLTDPAREIVVYCAAFT